MKQFVLPVILATLALLQTGCGEIWDSLVNGPFRAVGIESGQTPLPAEPIGPQFATLKLLSKSGSNPQNTKPVALGTKLIFSGSDVDHGAELWVHDTVAQTTTRIADIFPGVGPSDPSGMVQSGAYVYFMANDGTNGYQLWRTDGTANGTIRLSTVNDSGAARSTVLAPSPWGVTFVGFTTGAGRELWKSDGTVVGTVRVKDINPGTGDAFGTETFFPHAVMGGAIYFAANNGTNGAEVWRSDGTEVGTTMVLDVYNGATGSNPTLFTTMGSKVFFGATGMAVGYELWSTDGTSMGTALVIDLNVGGNDAILGSFKVQGSELFFIGRDLTYYYLWKTDGTALGTVRLSDVKVSFVTSHYFFSGNYIFVAGNSTSGGGSGLFAIRKDGVIADTLVFNDVSLGTFGAVPDAITIGTNFYIAHFSTGRGIELHKYDNVALTGGMVKEVGPATLSGTVGILGTAGANVLFIGNDGVNGAEVWSSDGTAINTNMLKNISAGASSTSFAAPFTFGAKVYFHADNAIDGSRLWESDGTLAGTKKVVFSPMTWDSSYGLDYLRSIVGTIGNKLLIRFYDNIVFEELAVLEQGTTSTPQVLKDIGTVGGSSIMHLFRLIKFGTKWLFQGDDGTNSEALWETDGTTAGTVMVADINSTNTFSNKYMQFLGTLGTNQIFAAFDSVNGYELRKSDGAGGTTSLVKNIVGAAGGITLCPGTGVELGAQILFCVNDGVNGVELYTTDGTAGGTGLVANINAAAANGLDVGYGIVGNFGATVGGFHYFAANDGTNGIELWRSNGTAMGTTLVHNIATVGNSSPTKFMKLGNKVVFVADDGTSGSELWISDGTSVGTTLLKDIRPGTTTNEISNLLEVSIDGVPKIFFFANDGTNGKEPWMTDGTTAGTIMLKDINPGASSSFVLEMPDGGVALDGKVYFAAYNPTEGSEIWVTDGTADGTKLYASSLQGPSSFPPYQLYAAFGKIYVMADSQLMTREIFIVEPPP